MQVAAELAKSAKDRMNNDAPAISTTVAEALQDEFDSVKGELSSEAEAQQVQATALNNQIAACNTQKDTEYADAMTTSEAALQGVSAHNMCRAVEASDCQTYRTSAETAMNSQPTCFSDLSESVTTNAEADAVTSCTGEQHQWLENHYASLQTAQSTCLDKRAECHQAQSAADSTFCTFKTELELTCQTFESCLAPAGSSTLVTQRDAQKEAIAKMLTGIQNMYHNIEVAECYLGLLKVDAAVTQSSLDHCAGLTIDSTNPANLTVTYPTFTDPAECDQSPLASTPDDAGWVSLRYGDWTHLVDDVTKCTPPATTSGPHTTTFTTSTTYWGWTPR